MTKLYIEITAGNDSARGLHIAAEGARLLANHHHTQDAAAIETTIKRAAAELGAVVPECTIATDSWTATVWQAEWYDSTHPAADRQQAHQEEMRARYA